MLDEEAAGLVWDTDHGQMRICGRVIWKVLTNGCPCMSEEAENHWCHQACSEPHLAFQLD